MKKQNNVTMSASQFWDRLLLSKNPKGIPPPTMSSSPRTPVGSLRIVTLAGRLTAFFGSLSLAASFCFFIFISFTKIQLVE